METIENLTGSLKDLLHQHIKLGTNEAKNIDKSFTHNVSNSCTPRTTECSFPMCEQQPPEPLVSASPRLVSLPFWPLWASIPSFRYQYPHSGNASLHSLSFFPHHFPFPLCPFPSPDIALLLLSLSSPTSLLSFREGGSQAATASFFSAWDTMLPLAGTCSP